MEALTLAKLLSYLWVPLLGLGGWFFRGTMDELRHLRDRVIRLESTSVTREDLEEILDRRFDSLERSLKESLKELKEDMRERSKNVI